MVVCAVQHPKSSQNTQHEIKIGKIDSSSISAFDILALSFWKLDLDLAKYVNTLDEMVALHFHSKNEYDLLEFMDVSQFIPCFLAPIFS